MQLLPDNQSGLLDHACASKRGYTLKLNPPNQWLDHTMQLPQDNQSGLLDPSRASKRGEKERAHKTYRPPYCFLKYHPDAAKWLKSLQQKAFLLQNNVRPILVENEGLR